MITPTSEIDERLVAYLRFAFLDQSHLLNSERGCFVPGTNCIQSNRITGLVYHLTLHEYFPGYLYENKIKNASSSIRPTQHLLDLIHKTFVCISTPGEPIHFVLVMPGYSSNSACYEAFRLKEKLLFFAHHLETENVE